VKGVGIEIDPELVRKAQDKASKEKVDHLVEFRAQDAFTVDVSPATVITLYILTEFNAKLRPILQGQLKPGSRVVSHDFEIQGWVPDRVERIRGISSTIIQYFCLKSAQRAIEPPNVTEGSFRDGRKNSRGKILYVIEGIGRKAAHPPANETRVPGAHKEEVQDE
jgi:hypothetical protein